ncbi:MAG: hypothetical protein ACNS61_05580 [Candidatus Wenzhouxiangella sp. M2_3B_020]
MDGLRAGAARVTGAAKRKVAKTALQTAVDYHGVRNEGTDYILREAKRSSTWDPETQDSMLVKAGQSMDLVGVMLTIVIATVIGFVGLQVMAQTDSSAEFESGSSYDNASQELSGGIESTFALVDVVYITLFLGLIIGALLFLRR